MMDYVILSFLVIAIVLAVLALDAEQRMLAIISLEGCTVCVGLLFLYVGALYVGVFHLLIYTGVLTVLFAVSSNYLDKEEMKNE